jgi:hypothetical protein
MGFLMPNLGWSTPDDPSGDIVFSGAIRQRLRQCHLQDLARRWEGMGRKRKLREWNQGCTYNSCELDVPTGIGVVTPREGIGLRVPLPGAASWANLRWFSALV